MSNRALVPVAAAARIASRPGPWLLIFGILYPAAVIVLELAGRWCAEILFDPLPTPLHVAVVAAVPLANLALWFHLRRPAPRHVSALTIVNGAVLAIAGFYTVVFLPLLPLATIGIMFYGLGLLPWAPLATFIAAWRLHHLAPPARSTRPLLAGLFTGAALLLLLDVPAIATRIGVERAASTNPAERARGLTLLRTLGDHDLLLRLCYGNDRPLGLTAFGSLALFDPALRRPLGSSERAREIYYRAYGEPYNAKPPPFRAGSRAAAFQLDDDHGAARVGGRIKGLQLVSSRLDGTLEGDDAVGYLEWTLAFRNDQPIAHEARIQIELPPGGVVSRATLWINGEEREAAYGGRAQVQAAYRQVAVAQRRDPLLVTTKGADRVLAQAFPVPPNGGTITVKLGITAPLELAGADAGRLVLPALTDRNAAVPADLRHAVWLESRRPLATSVAGLAAGRAGEAHFRLTGTLVDDDLSRARPAITVARDPAIARRVARLGDHAPVVQEIGLGAPAPHATVMLVVDGSAALHSARGALIAALDRIPRGAAVGVTVAGDAVRSIEPAPWSDAHRRAVVALLRSVPFAGGQDNAPALTEALQRLDGQPGPTLVWLHGPQPIAFADTGARLEQALARLRPLPRAILYALEPGPNELLPDVPWTWGARSIGRTGDPAGDLATLFASLWGAAPVVVRRALDAPESEPVDGSDHIARLWARDRVVALLRADRAGDRAEALALATSHHLVTPISGAVVLETRAQYEANGLMPAPPAGLPTIPTVPEPHEWALLLLACGALAWVAWRRRGDVTPVAA